MKPRLAALAWANKVILVSAGLYASTGCNSDSFKGTARPPQPAEAPKPAEHLIKSASNDPSVFLPRKSVQTIDSVDLVIPAVESRALGTTELRSQEPIDLYFVVDSTQSMVEEISIVRNGVQSIVDRLKGNGVDLRVGIVGYVDSFASVDQRTLEITADFNLFRNFLVTAVTPTTNWDYPEASMYAVRRAAELFERPSSRPNALKAIVLIGDVVGHNGAQSAESSAGMPRDCSINAAAQAINTLAQRVGDPSRVKFYYVVPDPVLSNPDTDEGARTACSGFNARTQMEALTAAILPQVPVNQRGGPLLDSQGRLAWPLTQNTLVETLSALLTRTTPQNLAGQCFVQKATAKSSGLEVFKWEVQDRANTLALAAQGNELVFSDALDTTVRNAGIHKVELAVERCCVLDQDIARGALDTCYSVTNQSFHYELESRLPQP